MIKTLLEAPEAVGVGAVQAPVTSTMEPAGELKALAAGLLFRFTFRPPARIRLEMAERGAVKSWNRMASLAPLVAADQNRYGGAGDRGGRSIVRDPGKIGRKHGQGPADRTGVGSVYGNVAQVEGATAFYHIRRSWSIRVGIGHMVYGRHS